MRKRIKLLSLIITAIFATTILFGCGAKPKETMLNAFKKNQQAKSYKVKGNINLEAEENKKTQNVTLSWEGTAQQEPLKAALDFNLDYQGISFKGSLYVNNDKMYIKLPAAIVPQNKYIEYDLKDINKDKKTDSKNDEKLATEMVYEIFNSIAEDKFSDGDKKEIDGDKLRIVRAQLSQSDFKTLLKNSAEIINKEKYSKLFKSGKNNLQGDLKKSLDDAANTMDKEIKLENFLFNVAVDKKGYARNEEIILNFKGIKENSSFKMIINNTLSNINKTQEFKFPDFNKNNTIPYNEYNMPFPGLPGNSLAQM